MNLFRARFQVGEIGMPRALETRFSIGRNCKNQIFTGNSVLVISGSICHVFWVSMGTFFMTLGAMGARLKFHGFPGLPGDTPKLRERTSGKVTVLFWGGGGKTKFI